MSDKLECALEVLRITAEHDVHELWWRTDGEYAPVTFLVNVNDQFGPAADAEAITPENLEIFRKAFEDCAELDRKYPPDPKQGENWGYAIHRADVLFVARFRKQRMWKRKWEKYPEAIKPLLLEAGETGFGWAGARAEAEKP